MKLVLFIINFIILFNFNILSFGTDSQDFKDKINKTYNFKPSKLTPKEQKEKSKVLNDFWNLVKFNLDKYLPLLRNELKDFTNNGFFLYDGAKLLIKHSQKLDDLNIASNAISRCTMEDVDRLDYFKIVHSLGKKGINTWNAVNRILDDPNFEVFISKHYLTIKQDIIVLYCLLVMDDKFYLDQIINRLNTENKDTVIKTIILCVSYSVTQQGQSAIKRFISTTESESLKDYARIYLKLENKSNLPKLKLKTDRKYFDDFLTAYVNREYEQEDFDFELYKSESLYHVKKEDYQKLKAFRKKIASKISEEALSEIKYFTLMMQLSYTSDN